jgi:hypothetical protein
MYYFWFEHSTFTYDFRYFQDMFFTFAVESNILNIDNLSDSEKKDLRLDLGHIKGEFFYFEQLAAKFSIYKHLSSLDENGEKLKKFGLELQSIQKDFDFIQRQISKIIDFNK